MSYTHTHLPEINKLQKQVEERPEVIKYYAKYDGFVGSTDSINFLTQKIDEYYQSKNLSKRI